MLLSEVLFIIFISLFLAMVVASLCRYIAIPYTVLLVILGLVINLLAPLFADGFSINQFHLTNDLVLFVFLPALIFEAALLLDARSLIKNLLPVLILAIPGMLLSMILVGFTLSIALEIELVVALLFGALISATDPVAVVALFKELGVSRRLLILVEGESLFNDATAIVLFNIVLSFLITANLSAELIFPTFLEFFRVFLGGVCVGAAISLSISEIMVRLHHGDNNIPMIFSMCIAYFSFIVAEHLFQVSGVMAVLTAAISLNMNGLMRLTHETTDTVHRSWGFIVLICNSLLFVLIGFSVDILQLLTHWQAILFAVVAVTCARAVSVYFFVPVTTRCFDLPVISYGERHVMWWGGLKGGLAIAMVLSIPDSVAEKQLLIELTVGVVLLSLLINATTIQHLIHWLKIDRLSNTEWIEFQQNKQRVKLSVDKVLQNFTRMRLLDTEMQHSVEGAFANDLKQVKLKSSQQQQVEQAHLNALSAERTELQYLHDIGMINYYTFVTFQDILTKDSERSVYFDKDEINKNILSHRNVTKYKKGSLVRLELSIFDFLTRHNSLQAALSRYQNIRFANRIQHDIAGILMANEGLKAIKKNELLLGAENFIEIREIYQSRLLRRQVRLNNFKNLYPDFYKQYEYYLFQRVALGCALSLVDEEYEDNKITAKVYRQLQKSLQMGLKQLPKIKITLQSRKPDDWIKKVPLFAGLPEDYLKQLASKSSYVNFLSGDTIFNQNDRGDTLYIVVSGKVNVFKLNPQGESEHVVELSEGSFVGERALLEGTRRSATVRAKTYATLLRITSDEVIQMSKRWPELQQRLETSNITK